MEARVHPRATSSSSRDFAVDDAVDSSTPSACQDRPCDVDVEGGRGAMQFPRGRPRREREGGNSKIKLKDLQLEAEGPSNFFRVSLRFVVLPFVVGVLVAVTLAIALVNYRNADATAETLSSQLLMHVGRHVYENVVTVFSRAMRVAETVRPPGYRFRRGEAYAMYSEAYVIFCAG
eukprot:tig00000219_g19440.t1